jgi:hypothetical protein
MRWISTLKKIEGNESDRGGEVGIEALLTRNCEIEMVTSISQ